MPLADNSAAIAAHVASTHPYPTRTAYHTDDYNLPIYIVNSADPNTPKITVRYSDYSASWGGPTQTMKDILFNDHVPIPTWTQSANGSDHSMAVYDIATNIIREYWVMIKQTDGSWAANWGGYTKDMMSLATTNYACQHNEGSDFATCNISGITQIGIEEVRRGAIGHAVGVVLFDAAAWLKWSWPAKRTDGGDSNANAAAEGQWFRFAPSLDIDSLGLRPLTAIVCKGIQKYGGVPIDRTLYCHAINFEPGYNELHTTGVNPWLAGGDLYERFGGNFSVDDFPWELTEWAPIDWGKPI